MTQVVTMVLTSVGGCESVQGQYAGEGKGGLGFKRHQRLDDEAKGSCCHAVITLLHSRVPKKCVERLLWAAHIPDAYCFVN